MVCVSVMETMSVDAAIVLFSNEQAQTIDTGGFVIDVQNYSNEIELKFGENIDAAIVFNRLADKFVVNRNIDLNNNELENARIENNVVAPTCDGAVPGKIYFNETDKESYICNGSEWKVVKSTKYAGYKLELIDQTDGTVSYISRTRLSDSKWLITKSDATSFGYAQSENNGGTNDLATAWTNRLTRIYGSNFTP